MSSTTKRILSALVTLPVYMFFILSGSLASLPLLIASTVITLFCLYEFYMIAAEKKQGQPFVIPGMIAAFFINILFYCYAFHNEVSGFIGSTVNLQFDVRWMMAAFAVFITILAGLHVFRRPLEGGIHSLAVTVFGLLFIVVPFAHIMLIKTLPGSVVLADGFSVTDGVVFIFLLHLVIMVNDSAAYFGGVGFGKHKVGFEVSPNKSWEGYFSGLLFSVLSVLLFNEVFSIFYNKHYFGPIEAVILGVVLSIAGDLGDLIESAVKRDSGIKDSGRIIPGHGGMWDVFDALIFSMPLFYYYLLLRQA